MAEGKTLERSQIEEKYKWNLAVMFENDQAWEKALNSLDDKAKELTGYAGKLSQSPAVLREFLDKKESLDRVMEDVYCYASCRQSEDLRQQQAQVMYQKAMGKYVQISSALSFFEPELLKMSDQKLEEFKNAPEMKGYEHDMDDLIRQKPHTLSEAEEKLMSGFEEMAMAPGDTADMLQDADMKFDPITLSDGSIREVTGSNYILLQSDPDREVREKAFHSYYKGYKEHINTFTSTYSANVKADAFKARTRHFDSARQMSLFASGIPLSVYDGLIDTVHKYMPAMYRYVALRKKILGLDELHYYDVYAPLAGDIKETYTYEQAKQMVLDAVKPLGEEYQKNVQRAYDERWIDVYPNVGKSGGAYSTGTYDSNPYIMTNFTGTLDSVSTIAHEMGHSQHTLLACTHQPPHYANYTLFVAEIASTVNENLLIEQLLSQTTDPKRRLYLLNQYLEGFKGTVYRQTMFAEFEKLAHEEVEKGGALSAQYLNDLYAGLVKQYFGDDLVMDDEVQYEWARIPHFYRSFYVYVYATGYSSAVALSEAILKEGQPAVKRYLEFLSAGSSMYPLDELKHGGVDLSTNAPIEQALQKFERIVEEAEKAYDQIKKEK